MKKISIHDLERLEALAKKHIFGNSRISLTPDTVLALVKEVISLRDHIFRLSVCDTIDNMLNEDDIEELTEADLVDDEEGSNESSCSDPYSSHNLKLRDPGLWPKKAESDEWSDAN